MGVAIDGFQSRRDQWNPLFFGLRSSLSSSSQNHLFPTDIRSDDWENGICEGDLTLPWQANCDYRQKKRIRLRLKWVGGRNTVRQGMTSGWTKLNLKRTTLSCRCNQPLEYKRSFTLKQLKFLKASVDYHKHFFALGLFQLSRGFKKGVSKKNLTSLNLFAQLMLKEVTTQNRAHRTWGINIEYRRSHEYQTNVSIKIDITCLN